MLRLERITIKDVSSVFKYFKGIDVNPTYKQICAELTKNGLTASVDSRKVFCMVYVKGVREVRDDIWKDWLFNIFGTSDIDEIIDANIQLLPTFLADLESLTEEQIQPYGAEAKGFVALMKTGKFETLEEIKVMQRYACFWNDFLNSYEEDYGRYYRVSTKGKNAVFFRPTYEQLLNRNLVDFDSDKKRLLKHIIRHVAIGGKLPSGIPVREAITHEERGRQALTDGRPELYMCPFCKTRYSTDGELKEHLLTFHTIGESK